MESVLHTFVKVKQRQRGNIKASGSGGIRTHASEETGALNQRLRPLGHATTLNNLIAALLPITSPVLAAQKCILSLQNGLKLHKKVLTPLGGLEPPTFRLTAERANQLRHRGSRKCNP